MPVAPATTWSCRRKAAGFRNAQSRYLIIEVESDFPAVSDDFRWVTPCQLDELLRYDHHVNVQARTLVAALRAL
ncbi:dTDP-4-dehydro-6-deoxy-alpha-D-glucopyranose 2,3-dehydratase [Streptomyces antimycoticus]